MFLLCLPLLLGRFRLPFCCCNNNKIECFSGVCSGSSSSELRERSVTDVVGPWLFLFFLLALLAVSCSCLMLRCFGFVGRLSQSF